MTQPVASEDTRALALEMFKDNVPCFFQLFEPSCPNAAAWVVHFRHLSVDDCGGQPPFPVCPEHRQLLERSGQPFWRAWFNADPILCDGCGEELAIDRFEAIP
ncbi:hypothetical protein [Streptomyces sp. NBC_00687]|uniref:hypothetical protein n=1 Tax=Streptomyces sp. NBC_00687 TaxID=2975807 RepID=UPI0022555058|nr:hypothetical protein [Streptomyces sp. NBC_00687]MCX4912847.1 hypothetical protein [Streptomyces sp. NBC_00687]